jgi:hypothetical protein
MFFSGDESTLVNKGCKTTLKQAKKKHKCDYYSTKVIQAIPSYREQMSCSTIYAFGWFHGSSNKHDLPFEISKKLANAYLAKNVFYDSPSCNTFENIQEVTEDAQQLAKHDKDRVYHISGNQNQGVANKFWNVTEILEMSSRVTAIIENGKMSLKYASCSKTKSECPFTKDSQNFKYCSEQDMVVEQKCCPQKDRSYWGKPGQDC